MEQKKKIALLIPALDDGGMGRVLETLSTGLSKTKYEQYIIVLINDRSIRYKYDGELIAITEEGKGVLGKAVAFFKRIFYVRRIKKKYQFDSVISFGGTANAINALTRQNEKVIMTQHSVTSIENKQCGMYGIIADLFVRTYNMADTLVVVSKFIKTDLIRNYNIDSNIIKVIYNGIDVEDVREKANMEVDTSFMKNKVNLISVGRLAESKGLINILKIAPKLINKIPNVQLIFIGDGEYRKCLEDKVRDLHLEKHVKFLGRKENPFPYVKAARVFLFPSRYEGFGMAFLEAMAIGVPVIATDCKAGPREVLADNDDYDACVKEKWMASYGVLVPQMEPLCDAKDDLSESEKEFLESIECLLFNSDLNDIYCLAGKNRSTDFSCSSMIRQYEQIIDAD